MAKGNSEILDCFVQGDVKPFYSKVYPGLLVYASRKLEKYSFLAEDCVQEAVVSAFDRRDTFTSLNHLKSFLFTCIHNSCVSTLRHNMLNTSESEIKLLADDASIDFIRHETLSLLYNAIEGLPPRLYSIFEMSFENGMKNAEIAEALGVSVATVKKDKAKLISILRDNVSEATMLLLVQILQNDI